MRLFGYIKKLLGSFSFRLYLLYFLMVGGAAWFIATRGLQAVDISVNQAAEEVLVDTAYFMAEIASQNTYEGQINVNHFRELIPDYLSRKMQANIYQHMKTHPDLHIYITNADGRVIYDSTGQSEGKDFSQWRDVKNTLQGRYGARSSPLDHTLNTAIPEEKGLFVAAPIIGEDQIIGTLTVVKANKNLGDYVVSMTEKVTYYALAVFAISLLAGAFITWWLLRSVKKLTRYAKQLGQGNHIAQPKIIHSEFKQLANAVEKMYEDLEGKEYVENYVHTMAHELKSPLTGMIATTELLQQDLPTEKKAQFIDNLQTAARRMTTLIERLLALASVEKRQTIEHREPVALGKVIDKILSLRETTLTEKQLSVTQQLPDHFCINGEPTLIEQSVANLIDNAIDFTHIGTTISISAENTDKMCHIRIKDAGDGIAEFAKKRLFERFFSTPRPDSQQRSSGLGLAFVKEVMTLHGGTVNVDNHPDGGAIATLSFPNS